MQNATENIVNPVSILGPPVRHVGVDTFVAI